MNLSGTKYKEIILYFLVLVIIISTSCAVPQDTPGQPQQIPTILFVPKNPTPSATPFQPIPLPPTPTLPPVINIYISPGIPQEIRHQIERGGYVAVDNPDAAFMKLVVSSSTEGDLASQSKWIYALVAAFPTVADAVTSDQLLNMWRGNPVGPFAGRRLIASQSTFDALSEAWGMPDANTVSTAGGDLVEALWHDRNLWAIVPFETLEPRLKVLTIDGQSPVQNSFDDTNYPLKIVFETSCLLPCPVSELPELPRSNRDPSALTTLVMTGVTALVRATAVRMELKGINYPGRDIRDWLRNADITHISNEVPFAPGCPYPSGVQERLIFCSDPRYISLLEDMSADVIELTGNHANDWGTDAFLYTLDMYTDRGWVYFGGGKDLAEARKVLTVEHNGNRLAFIGCNPVGPLGAWATDFSPGTAPCDDYIWMTSEISRFRQDGYLPIATFQYFEYYQPTPPSNQRGHFRKMAQAGAVIVSGSQAHFPMTMEFIDGAFIHYGLGNLFFDQMDIPVVGTRREFIDRHVFYKGRHISTELLTAMLEDYARPRPMSPSEREEFLKYIFNQGGW